MERTLHAHAVDVVIGVVVVVTVSDYTSSAHRAHTLIHIYTHTVHSSSHAGYV